MNTVLVQPPNMQRRGKWKKQNVCRTPTNLAMLASYIREQGRKVSVVDLDIEGGSFKEMVGRIMEGDPGVAGFTCLTPRFPIVLDLAAECKKANPGIVTVAGGPHVCGQNKNLLKNPAIDFAIMGEGEEAFLDLLDAVEAGKDPRAFANIVWRHNDEVRVNPSRPFIKDLDSLPLPAWDLLRLDKYTDPSFFKGPHLGIMSSRGCPFDCIFCASKVVMGKKVRFRSPANIIGEMDLAVKNLGISEFMFYDDNLTLDRRRALDLCDGIGQKGLHIRFFAQLRVDTLDAELLRRLKGAGCFAVAIGVESGDEGILKNIGKGITKRQILSGCAALKEAGMPFVASYIIGHPGDTHESIRATLEFAKRLDADQAKFLIATPYPGTKLYEMAVERGILSEEGAADLGDHTYFQHVAANLSCVSDKDLLAYQQKAFDDYDKQKRQLVAS